MKLKITNLREQIIGPYSRLLRYVRPYVGRIMIAMVAMLISGSASAAPALLAKNVFDDLFIAQNREMLVLLPLALVALFFLKGGFFYLQAVIMATVGDGVVRDLRNDIYRRYLVLDLPFYHRNKTGDLMTRISSDTLQVRAAVTDALTGSLQHVFTIIGLVAIVFYRNWELAVMALAVFPIAVFPVVSFSRMLKKLSRKSQDQIGLMSAILSETLSGIRIVKAFGMEGHERERFEDESERLYRVNVAQMRIQAINLPVMEFIGSLGGAVVLYVGGMMVIDGKMTTGDLMSFLAALFMIYDPVKKMNKLLMRVMQGIGAVERVFAVTDEEIEITEAPEAVTLDGFTDTVKFDHVDFWYNEGEPVLDDIKLQVTKGEVLALVGESGGGKSTLMDLIPRFYDVRKGAISIDGHDIRNITKRSLRDHIGIVSQYTILFNESVRNNIAYGRPDIPMEKVVAAARMAHAHEFIEELPQGYDTVIGEQGLKLSGGQRQRISIARAILKNAPILILDEATSALDNESEREVQKALEELMQGRTTFVIAHRLSTITHADRIVVISNGRIVEEGAHEKLLAEDGLYAKLYNMQFREQQVSAALNSAAD